jgi:hypothetical protein
MSHCTPSNAVHFDFSHSFFGFSDFFYVLYVYHLLLFIADVSKVRAENTDSHSTVHKSGVALYTT